jgi:hypothetical protein
MIAATLVHFAETYFFPLEIQSIAGRSRWVHSMPRRESMLNLTKTSEQIRIDLIFLFYDDWEDSSPKAAESFFHVSMLFSSCDFRASLHRTSQPTMETSTSRELLFTGSLHGGAFRIDISDAILRHAPRCLSICHSRKLVQRLRLSIRLKLKSFHLGSDSCETIRRFCATFSLVSEC